MTPGGQRKHLYVDNDLCHNCRRCLAQQVCAPRAIIRIDHDDPPFIDVHRCHGCLICLPECPFQAMLAV